MKHNFFIILLLVLFIAVYYCTDYHTNISQDNLNKEIKLRNNQSNFEESTVRWYRMYAYQTFPPNWFIICAPPALNCMEEVIVYGKSTSQQEFELFKSLFEKNKNNISVATSEKVKGYFNNYEFDSFLYGLREKPEYINLLKSGEVKIIETYNTETMKYVYLVIDKNLDEQNFDIKQVLFGFQIELK